MIAALVPVKQLAEGKSRLLPELDPGAREALSLAMLRDVLAALDAAECVERRAVVTPDETVAGAARAAGAEVVLFHEPGLNAALDAGARELELGEDDALLVILGDVAGARADDIDALCAALDRDGPSAALAPASDGGTAALVRRPHDAFATCFGAASAARHRKAADLAGVPLREVSLPSLTIDLDQADDIHAFLSGFPGFEHSEREDRVGEKRLDGPAPPDDERGGRHTRALLRSLGWAGS